MTDSSADAARAHPDAALDAASDAAPDPGPDWARYGDPIDFSVATDSRVVVLGTLDPAPQRILELGSSAGLMTAVLRERGHRVTAVEIDPVAAELAGRHAEQVLVGDLDGLDDDGRHLLDGLAPASFDTVIAADVLEHLRDPDDCLRRAVDLLRPDGTVVLSIPNIAHGDVRLALLAGRFDYRSYGLLDRTHIHLFTLRSVVQMLRNVGLAPVDWQRVTHPFGHTEIDVPENYVEFGRRFLDGEPEIHTYQWIITCRRAERAGDAAVWPDMPGGTDTIDGLLGLVNAPIAHPDGIAGAEPPRAPGASASSSHRAVAMARRLATSARRRVGSLRRR